MLPISTIGFMVWSIGSFNLNTVVTGSNFKTILISYFLSGIEVIWPDIVSCTPTPTPCTKPNGESAGLYLTIKFKEEF